MLFRSNIGERVEYVRSGSKWATLDANVRTVSAWIKQGRHYGGIHSVYNIYNCTRLDELRDYADTVGLDILWQTLYQPDYLDPAMHSPEVKDLARNSVIAYQKKYKLTNQEQGFFAEVLNRLDTIESDWQMNAPLFVKDGLNSYGNLTDAAQTNLNYKYHTSTGGATSIITLPYSTANLAIQKLASNTISLNPFAVSIAEGVLDINPPMDMWVQTSREPDVLVVDPNMTLFRSGNTFNVLSASDWQTIPGTTYTVSSQQGRTVTVNTYADQQQQTVTGNYDKVTSINGNFITDISMQPYMRSQNLILRAQGMKINTPVSVYFDGTKVNDYIVQPNIIELTSVNGTFQDGDVVGYMSGGNFKIGRAHV